MIEAFQAVREISEPHVVLSKDTHHVWPPCSPLSSHIDIPRLVVESANGPYLYTNQGPILDAISSWWCKALGHRPLPVIEAIKNQLDSFEHVIGANTTYPKLTQLAEQLAQLTQNQHAFFASDGSSAVEIALKLVIHLMQLQGSNRKTWITLENSYHGETIATLSVSDVDCYNLPFKSLGLQTIVLKDIPYVSGTTDLLWHDCSSVWSNIEAQLAPYMNEVCGIIVEPIVQGAGGMKIYSADFLKRLADYAKQHHAYLIADEIMTGLGRTGEWLASHHANIKPDLICLSKALTLGTAPLSCVMISDEIFEQFKQNPESPFLHSHTYSSHPLGVAAADAAIKLLKQVDAPKLARHLGEQMFACLQDIAHETGYLKQLRMLGGIVAAEINGVDDKPIGRTLSQQALKHGLLLRPLGNTVYWFPPLNTAPITIEQIAEKTKLALQASLNL